MKRTSVMAYHKIKAAGLLSKKRMEVYEVIYRHGPMTAGESEQFLRAVMWKGSICSRLFELVGQGVIEEAGLRTCKVTGQFVTVYEVTDKLPVKFARPLGPLALANIKIAELETTIVELKKKLKGKGK